MRYFLAILFIATFAAITEYILPWWSLAIPAFVICFAMRLSAGKAFGTGFTAIFLLWLIVGLWRDTGNHHILSTRMADLILHTKNGVLYLLLSSVVGGLTGGLAGWSAAQLGALFFRKERALNPAGNHK